MRIFHMILLGLSIILALYEVLLIMIYHDISLSYLVLALSIILSIYCYAYLHYSVPKFITAAIMLILISFIGIEGCIVYYSFDHTNNQTYDTIVVLGAQVKGDDPSPALDYRIQKANEYLTDHPDTLVIASGSQGENENKTEAECIAENLNQDANVILEEKSTSTYENLEYSSKYFKGKTAIISNSFHLFRVHLIASKMNLDVALIPASNHLITYPHFLIREYFGVLKELL